jgi:hypothetical protein
MFRARPRAARAPLKAQLIALKPVSRQVVAARQQGLESGLGLQVSLPACQMSLLLRLGSEIGKDARKKIEVLASALKRVRRTPTFVRASSTTSRSRGLPG